MNRQQWKILWRQFEAEAGGKSSWPQQQKIIERLVNAQAVEPSPRVRQLEDALYQVLACCECPPYADCNGCVHDRARRLLSLDPGGKLP